MSKIEDVLARLDKETLKQFQMASEITRDFIPTASMGLNMVVGGGLPKGHQTTIWGNQSAGKSALLTQTIGLAQKSGLACAYIDAEKTFDPAWATRLGVNVEELPVSNKSMISEVTDLSIDWIHAGMDLIIIDSMSQLMPRSFYEKDGEIKDFEKTGQIGQQARELGQMCRMISGENPVGGTAVVFISQVRMDLGGFIPTQKPSGGMEVGHVDSLRVKVSSSQSDSKALKGTTQYGEIFVEENIGRVVKWDVSKNKVNGRYGSGEYNLITQGEHVGLDYGAELRDYGVLYGIVEKVGNSRFVINGESIHGKDKAAAFIRETEGIADFLAEEIERKLTIYDRPSEDATEDE